jgi:hypothetical protein
MGLVSGQGLCLFAALLGLAISNRNPVLVFVILSVSWKTVKAF